MKIAIISDIHGNIAALDAVLADAAARHADRIVNLGDICSGALFPRETADRLMALDIPTIRGNHERQVLACSPDKMGASDRHAALSMRGDQLEWLASLPPTLRLSDDILLVHGTPDSDLTYFLETVTEDGIREASLDEVSQRAGPASSAVILCGHTHIARSVMLDDGRLIVNPGSVGLQAFDYDQPFAHVVESGSPHARYAVLTGDDKIWSAQLIEIEYDWEQAARDAEANGRPDSARALRTGYA